MPPNILNLSAYTVTSFQETDHDYHIDAVAVRGPIACPHCHNEKFYSYGRREQMVKDLPMHGKRVGIYIDTRRYRCRSCLKTFYETLPSINAKRSMTNRLVDWIGKQSIKRTFSSIAEEVGVAEGTVRLIFKDYVADLNDKFRYETPEWMGIDEIHLIRPRGVIANIREKTIVELLPNRTKETMIRYLSGLENHSKVRYVAIDMWKPYRDAVQRVMPDATIIIDKFHVLRMANDAMERVRKSCRESLTPKQRRGLMHDRFVMLKREDTLSDQEALLLSGWTKNFPTLGRAYQLKEDFFKIYDSKDKADALEKFAAWERSLTQELRPAFSNLLKAWRNWQPYITAYFDHPVTNAYTESLNNLIRVVNRLGRGYSFDALRAKILYAEGALKKRSVKPKFNRRQKSERRAGEMSYAMMIQHKEIKREIQLGADISTLAKMIENGRL